jgi:hypothetical protein
VQIGEIGRIETELGITLPQAYKDVLARYPFGQAGIASEMLIDDAEWLIRTHRRRASLRPPRHKAWSARLAHFQIGSDGSEKEYFLDLSSPAAAVIEHDIEQGTARAFAASIAEYVDVLTRMDAQIEVEEAAGEARSRLIPRWKQNLHFYRPLLIFLFVAIVVIPIVLATLAAFVRWLLAVVRS